jgi:hypothetical protein
MPVTTSQQITRYFQQFSQAEVTFTREVVKAIKLNSKQVYVKCLGAQWPCIVYAASMTSAKIIANLAGGLNESVKKANNLVQLRFSFSEAEKSNPLTFFVSARVVGVTPYGDGNKGLFFANLDFSQRPPDDLILILGQLLEANVNATRRREERIPLSPHSIKQLGLAMDRCMLSIDGEPRRAILRDISFSGCKAVVVGVPQLLVDKPVVVRFVFSDPEQLYDVGGVICRYDPVEGRDDIAAFGIHLDEEHVPMGYKMRVNAALKQFRTKTVKGRP